MVDSLARTLSTRNEAARRKLIFGGWVFGIFAIVLLAIQIAVWKEIDYSSLSRAASGWDVQQILGAVSNDELRTSTVVDCFFAACFLAWNVMILLAQRGTDHDAGLWPLVFAPAAAGIDAWENVLIFRFCQAPHDLPISKGIADLQPWKLTAYILALAALFAGRVVAYVREQRQGHLDPVPQSPNGDEASNLIANPDHAERSPGESILSRLRAYIEESSPELPSPPVRSPDQAGGIREKVSDDH